MSEIRANTVSDLAGTGPVTLTGQFAAKAWIHYDQSPSTVIGDSFNVASLTDAGVGNQIVAYTSVFINARYAGAGTSEGVGNVAWQGAPLSGSVNIQTTATNTGVQFDYNFVCVTYHGDLA
jgi:hypothetical protein